MSLWFRETNLRWNYNTETFTTTIFDFVKILSCGFRNLIVVKLTRNQIKKVPQNDDIISANNLLLFYVYFKILFTLHWSKFWFINFHLLIPSKLSGHSAFVYNFVVFMSSVTLFNLIRKAKKKLRLYLVAYGH